jgi:hypothetical protein
MVLISLHSCHCPPCHDAKERIALRRPQRRQIRLQRLCRLQPNLYAVADLGLGCSPSADSEDRPAASSTAHDESPAATRRAAGKRNTSRRDTSSSQFVIEHSSACSEAVFLLYDIAIVSPQKHNHKVSGHNSSPGNKRGFAKGTNKPHLSKHTSGQNGAAGGGDVIQARRALGNTLQVTAPLIRIPAPRPLMLVGCCGAAGQA